MKSQRRMFYEASHQLTEAVTHAYQVAGLWPFEDGSYASALNPFSLPRGLYGLILD